MDFANIDEIFTRASIVLEPIYKAYHHPLSHCVKEKEGGDIGLKFKLIPKVFLLPLCLIHLLKTLVTFSGWTGYLHSRKMTK